jgi:hypothetical protein
MGPKFNTPLLCLQVKKPEACLRPPPNNAQKLGHFEVPFCPLLERQEIVRRVKKLFALVDPLEARFVKGQKRVDSIIQAILAKAFRGELVPTEFELAKGEGRSFESAEDLFEEISRKGGTARLKRQATKPTSETPIST